MRTALGVRQHAGRLRLRLLHGLQQARRGMPTYVRSPFAVRLSHHLTVLHNLCVCARDSEIVILFIYFFFRVWELQLNVGGPRVFALYVYIIRCCVAVKLTHFMYVECRRTDYSSTCYD